MAKDPRKLIREGRKEIKEVMKLNLEVISARMIKSLVNKSKKATSSRKVNATKKNDVPVGQVYKAHLKEAMAVVVREAINIARQEVPSPVKFAEFDDLPPALKRFLEAQSALYADTQISDLHKRLRFKYQDTLPITDNPEALTGELSNDAAAFIDGAPVTAASGKIVAASVNTARKAYFENPEVMDKIEAFQYMNPEPNAPICKDLQNHVFRADDPNLDKYTPPFHFNCDGWLRPILVGNLKGRKPERYVPTKAAQKSIQFTDGFTQTKTSKGSPKATIQLSEGANETTRTGNLSNRGTSSLWLSGFVGPSGACGCGSDE